MPTLNWQQRKVKDLEKHFKGILEILGYDLHDPNFEDTPRRAAKLWFEELYKHESPTSKVFTTFPEKHEQMIVLINHKTWSRCPHHLERVKMIVSIGYIPENHVLGLSKLARVTDYFAKGLILQENFTDTLSSGLFEALKPKGVGVYVVGEHHCMCARGVKSEGKTVTCSLKGIFLSDPNVKREFLDYALHSKGGFEM